MSMLFQIFMVGDCEFKSALGQHSSSIPVFSGWDVNVYDIVFRMTRHCNSTPRMSGTAGGLRRGESEVISFPFFHAVVLSFGIGECRNLFIGTPMLCNCTMVGQINGALMWSCLTKRRMPWSKLFLGLGKIYVYLPYTTQASSAFSMRWLGSTEHGGDYTITFTPEHVAARQTVLFLCIPSLT